jgi:hypothetical protein
MEFPIIETEINMSCPSYGYILKKKLKLTPEEKFNKQADYQREYYAKNSERVRQRMKEYRARVINPNPKENGRPRKTFLEIKT